MKASTGMPGVSLTSPKLGDLVGRHRDANEIIALPGALVGGSVGPNADDRAVELGRGAHVEGGETKHDRLAKLDLIDILGLDLGFDQERIRLGHDQHDGIAGGNDAADGIGRRLEDQAVLRRAQIGTLELIFGGYFAFDIFADLAVGFAQLLGHLAGELLIDLQDLQLGFDDLALSLGDGCNELSMLALQARLLAFQGRKSVDLNQVLRPQIADALKLWPMIVISLPLASCWAVSPVICSSNCLTRCCS